MVDTKAFHRDGFVVARGLIPQERIEGTRQLLGRIAEDLLNQLKADRLIEDTHPDEPFERRFIAAGEHASAFGRSWRPQMVGKELFDLHRCAPLADALQAIFGADVLGHRAFNGRPKLPKQDLTVVPWHQDSGYYGPETGESLIATAWIPLVPVDADTGCMQVIPGSHKKGYFEHRNAGNAGSFLEIPPEHVDESKVVTCAMKPGDVLFMDNLVFHRSIPNTSDIVRWSVDLRFVRDGDNPGGRLWSDDGFDWIIRSDTRPETSFEDWLKAIRTPVED